MRSIPWRLATHCPVAGWKRKSEKICTFARKREACWTNRCYLAGLLDGTTYLPMDRNGAQGHQDHRPAQPHGTVVEVVGRHALERGNATAFSFVRGDGQPVDTLTFAQLNERVTAVAQELARAGVHPGDRVLVMYPASLDYICGLLGCLAAGAVAVPTYPPNPGRLVRAGERVAQILDDAAARVAIGKAEHLHALVATLGPEQLCGLDVARPSQGHSELRLPTPTPETPAILQYTSGSTSDPKGVLLTHANLMANLQHCLTALAGQPDDIALSWLPPFHDMGLIGGLLGSVFTGVHCVLMPTEAFIRKPVRWLQAVSRFRASILMTPNFALDLCVQRIKPAEIADLDLSCVRLCLVGSEPISADTLDRFVESFRPAGIRRQALFPAYGLAEATLLVTGSKPDAPPRVRTFDATALEHGQVVALPDGEVAGRRIVSCGRAVPGTEVRIVDPDVHTPMPDGHVGEVWVRGPSVAAGYWKGDDTTQQTFGATVATEAESDASCLRTGDLGFVDDGELFITGRRKELIIVRGRNLFPHDLERAVQALDPALVRGGGAAFGFDEGHGEQVVLVQEFDKRMGSDPEALVATMPDAILSEFGVSPYAVVLIKRGQLPKTSSGKIKRRAVRDAWLAGDFTTTAVWPATRAPASYPDPPPRRVAPILPPAPVRTPTVDANRNAPADPATRAGQQSHDTRSVTRFLVQALADRLGLAIEDIDPRASLAQYGADSLVLAELAEELEQWLGQPLPTTITYDNPSIAELAQAILELERARSLPGRPKPEQSARRVGSAPQDRKGGHSRDPIAIVGMGCRFPGADTTRDLWQLLQGAVDAVTEVPAWRWNVDALYDPEPRVRGKVCTRRGGFIAGIDEFDPGFFGLSTREAERMDPQQRLTLEVAWEALEDACIDPVSLAGTETGVFMGAASSDYAVLYGGDLNLIDGDYGTGNSTGIIANRVSHCLNLQGPSVTIDAACASGLVALDAACTALERGDCELAIVGAANAILAPEASVYLSQAGMLSASGSCRAFDAAADGFVRGEGAGVVVITRLSHARRLGVRARALVAGIAVNHTGQANGLVTPNGRAQQRVIARALQRAGIDAEDLGYIEAHGVGTPVSDAVEVNALGALMRGRSRERPCLLGSIKTNLGHLEAAAGIAALIKTTLALEHEEVPAHLHFNNPHPDLELDRLPLEIPTAPVAWPRDPLGSRRRYAGVSAFGFGGANAHAVLTEAPALDANQDANQAQGTGEGHAAARSTRERPVRRRPQRPAQAPEASDRRPWHLVLLSGRTEAALDGVAARLAHGCREAAVGDICHTLAEGRAHFRHRRALLVADGQGLDKLLRKGSPLDGCEPPVEAPSSPPGLPTARMWQGVSPAQTATARVTLTFDEALIAPKLIAALARSHPIAKEAFDATARKAAALGVPGAEMVLSDTDGSHWLRDPRHRDVARFAVHRALAQWFALSELKPVAAMGQGAGEYSAACVVGALSWDDALSLLIKRADTLASLRPGMTVRLTRRQFSEAADRVPLSPPRYPLILGSAGDAQFGPDAPVPDGHFGRQLLHTPDPEDGRGSLNALETPFEVFLGPAGDQLTGGPRPTPLGLLAQEDHPWESLLSALGQLYVAGAAPRLAGLDAPFGYRMCEVPHYPFQRQRCWLEFPERQLEGEERTPSSPPISHPLLKEAHTVTRHRSGFTTRAGRREDERAGER